jgi:O-antigen/teichoic acid export membrane protein
VACKNGDRVKQKIISNIFSSGIEKIYIIAIQFITSIILIRLLPREAYGIIGIVMGYFAFINIVNISLESIILRDHKKFDDNLNYVMQNFFAFNLFKSILFSFIAIVLGLVLSSMYENSGFIYAIWSITFITIADTITAPLIIYFSSKFNQKLVTKISIFRYTLSLVLLSGLFVYPELWFIALKDFIVSFIFIIIWFYISSDKLLFTPQLSSIDFKFIKETLFSYSLWTHLNGVVTNFIYRSDTFFLSFFVSLAIVGNYNIALNSANIANILPMIIGYQNSVAISNAKDNIQVFKISNHFILLSLLIGLVTIIGFYLLGDFYLYIITGQENNSEIFFYMMCIVTSLVIVKSFASPLNAYINIYGKVKKLFIQGMIPVLIFTCLIYFYSSFYYGSKGIALANIGVSFFWLFVIIYQASKNGYVFSTLLGNKNA